MSDKQDLSNDQKRDELLDEMLVSRDMLQIRVVRKDGTSSTGGFIILKTDDTWYCSLVNPDAADGEPRVTTNRSKKSARIALNSAIKKFLDREGYDENIEMISANSILSEGEVDG